MSGQLENYRIREADTDDALAISRLIVPLTEQYILPDVSPDARQGLLNSMSEQGLQKLMSDGCRYHLAEMDAQTIAVIGLYRHSHLYHLFVAAEFQRRGIARRLWEVVLNQCIEAGAGDAISVNAAPTARRFYERLGFKSRGDARQRNGITTLPMVYAINTRK